MLLFMKNYNKIKNKIFFKITSLHNSQKIPFLPIHFYMDLKKNLGKNTPILFFFTFFEMNSFVVFIKFYRVTNIKITNGAYCQIDIKNTGHLLKACNLNYSKNQLKVKRKILQFIIFFKRITKVYFPRVFTLAN